MLIVLLQGKNHDWDIQEHPRFTVTFESFVFLNKKFNVALYQFIILVR